MKKKASAKPTKARVAKPTKASILVRCSADELEQLHNKAKEADLSVQAYLLRCAGIKPKRVQSYQGRRAPIVRKKS